VSTESILFLGDFKCVDYGELILGFLFGLI
jgi:hypothetical protein